VVPGAQRRLASRSESGGRAMTAFLWVTTPLVVAGLGWILLRPAGSWRAIPTAAPLNAALPREAVATPPAPQKVGRLTPNLPTVPESKVSLQPFPANATLGMPFPANGIGHRFVLDGDEGRYDIRIRMSGTHCLDPGSPPGESPYAALAVNVDGKSLQTLRLHTDGPEDFTLPKVALDSGTALDLEMSGDLALQNNCDRNLLIETLEIAPSRN